MLKRSILGSLTLITGLSVVGISSLSYADRTSHADKETATLMRQIFAVVNDVVPSSFNPDEFNNPKNRESFLAKFKRLEDLGEKLKKRGKSKEQGFRYMSKTFSMDVKQIYTWYRQKDYEGARFYLYNIVDDCVECHSKLPSNSNYPGSMAFIEDMKLDKLPVLEKARLLIAIRQFNKALSTYESYFLSEEGASDSFYTMTPYIEYLKISLRVKHDAARPYSTFNKLKEKGKLPKFVVRLFDAWISNLKMVHDKKLLKSSKMTDAKALIAAGKKQMTYGVDRVGLVQYIAASAILQNLIAQEKLSKTVKSEIYYWLGITESLVSHSFWVSESKTYFEAAIRIAPESTYAAKAFAQLEEQTILEFTGSSGVRVPPKMRDWLDELRKLVNPKAK